MTSSDSPPKLPIWIFALTDAALLGAAVLIALEAERPLSPIAIVSIVACVVAGAIVLFVPLVARYERQKNEALDERQRALESLATTVTASAEQISIAAGGLHGVADLFQKNLRHAEQLPHKLQDKIAEFKAQLDDATETEKEDLEKELVSLRSSESERLEAASTKIAKAAAELAKLEAATQQHLTAANEALAKLSMGTAAAIGKAQAAAEQALAQARTEAARGLGETAGQAARALESAKTSALAEIDSKLTATVNVLLARFGAELAAKLPPFASSPASDVAEPPVTATAASETEMTLSAAGAAKPGSAAHPPKRPRKPRRDDPETSPTTSTQVAADSSPSPVAAGAAPEPKEEPAPIPSANIPEVTPVAPDTAQPFIPPPPVSAISSIATPPASPADAAAESQKIPRRRTAKKPEPAPGEKAELDLGIEEPAPANGAAEKTLSSDGATRLLVTAYIGIGNRLFIRGTGPGLSWEKGVPLQFVSIGKWRWETNDATGPVQFKLYKNDDTECTALGQQNVEPGYQQEVTAAF